jgi:hypothetical protein
MSYGKAGRPLQSEASSCLPVRNSPQGRWFPLARSCNLEIPNPLGPTLYKIPPSWLKSITIKAEAIGLSET